MNNVSFQDGDGLKKFSGVTGTGTQQDPYVFLFDTPDGATIQVTFDANAAFGIRDVSGNRVTVSSNGALTTIFNDEVAAPLPSSTSGIIGLIRGLWGSVTSLVNSFGFINELASASGTLLARVRFIANAFTPPSRYVSYGSTAVDRVAFNATLVSSVYIWNKSDSIRYFQLFNQSNIPTTGTPAFESFVIAPREKFTLDTTDFGIGGSQFSFGLCWGWSSSESTFVAASASELSTIIRWRTL